MTGKRRLLVYSLIILSLPIILLSGFVIYVLVWESLQPEPIPITKRDEVVDLYLSEDLGANWLRLDKDGSYVSIQYIRSSGERCRCQGEWSFMLADGNAFVGLTNFILIDSWGRTDYSKCSTMDPSGEFVTGVYHVLVERFGSGWTYLELGGPDGVWLRGCRTVSRSKQINVGHSQN